MDVKKTWLVEMPIAHRGLHNQDLPENSLGAFENAITHGFAIELDVRCTDDGKVVVFHDESLGRMTNSDGYISNMKKADLENFRLLKTEFTIPTFEETLALVNGRTPILIEIKNANKVGELEKRVIEILRSYSGEVAVQSFNPMSMGYFKEHAPHILRGQLSSFFAKNDIPSLIKRTLLKKLKLNNYSAPDFISYCAEFLPNKYVTKTKLPVLAWTIRSNADMEKVIPYCDNIIFEKFIPKVTE